MKVEVIDERLGALKPDHKNANTIIAFEGNPDLIVRVEQDQITISTPNGDDVETNFIRVKSEAVESMEKAQEHKAARLAATPESKSTSTVEERLRRSFSEQNEEDDRETGRSASDAYKGF